MAGELATGVYLPRGMFRNRRLLDLAHRIEQCKNCGSVQPEGCEPAHSDEQIHGRGKDNKSHDCFFAALCRHCHAWYDYGSKTQDPSRRFDPTREGKHEMFERAKDATLLDCWRNGWLKAA